MLRHKLAFEAVETSAGGPDHARSRPEHLQDRPPRHRVHAHLLLEAAVIADEKRRAIDEEQSEEDDFYEGKVAAAKFFVNFILPGVQAKMAVIVGGDRSALDMPDRGFSTAV
jgi:hypothetical protein